MALGLNYSYKEINKSSLLANYIYLLNKKEDFSLKDEPHICRNIDDGKLLEMLTNSEYDDYFERPEIQKIMFESYEYEVLMKFKSKDIKNDDEKNQRLITLFNSFFNISYEDELQKYCQTCNRISLEKTHLAHDTGRYDDVTKAVDLFLNFVYALFKKLGYLQEIEGLKKFVQDKLVVVYTPGISGNTDPSGGKILVEVGNNTYTTLFHELIHAINRFFRFSFYEESIRCYENYTKTNEGLANFVAYHLMNEIISGDIESIDTMQLNPIFFSMYIDIYATVREHGSNDRKHNFDIIYQQLVKFEEDLLTDEKAKFYYNRFYKFFHYDQHTYFYPKELMYYLGYQEIRELFSASQDKQNLLADSLLGRICL